MAVLFIIGAGSALAKTISSSKNIRDKYETVVFVFTTPIRAIDYLTPMDFCCSIDLYSNEPRIDILSKYADSSDNTIVFLATPTLPHLYESKNFRIAILNLLALERDINDYLPSCRKIIMGSTIILTPDFIERTPYKELKQIEYLYFRFFSDAFVQGTYVFMPPIMKSSSFFGKFFILSGDAFLLQFCELLSNIDKRPTVYFGNLFTKIVSMVLHLLKFGGMR
jgi:hypothetical protein